MEEPTSFAPRQHRAAKGKGARQQRLREFLIAHRESISPESAGLPRIGRRRTPGLRREEVAFVAGVGVTWYTWLEQGRDIQVSAETLLRIANALQLTADECTHLFQLAGLPGREVPTREVPDKQEIQAVLDGFRDGPAFVLGVVADVEAYNTIADAMFQFKAVSGPFANNQIWRYFMDPVRRDLYCHWEELAPLVVGQLRLMYGKYAGDPYVEQMLSSMLGGSESFRSLWAKQQAINTSSTAVQLRAPSVGIMQFVTVRFRPLSAMDWMAIFLSPCDAETRCKVARL